MRGERTGARGRFPYRYALAAFTTAVALSSAKAARADDAHPSAPYAEMAGGVAGTAVALAIVAPIGALCSHHGAPGCEAMWLTGLFAATTAASAGGVALVGSAYPRHGSGTGAVLGAAAGSAIALGAVELGFAVEDAACRRRRCDKDTPTWLLATLVGSTLLPSLGATIGYEAFRDRSDAPSRQTRALVVGAVRFLRAFAWLGRSRRQRYRSGLPAPCNAGR